jgi:hypothetical protein
MADRAPPATGAFCAIEIEGSLETRPLGYPAPTAAGAAALRALVSHGFRVVLVTPDPFGDLRERCEAYRVYGGLAELGAVAYDHTTGENVTLAPEAARADLEALRATLLYMPGVHVDRGSRVGVRAYRAEGDGGLEPALAAWALAEAGVEGRVRALHTPRHTDFGAEAVDAETGLLKIRARLGAAGPEGLAAEVDALVGHRPGRCSICRAPKLSAEARAFQQALEAAQNGAAAKRQGTALSRLPRRAV